MPEGNTRKELCRLLTDTFRDMDNGRHCWLPICGWWFTATPEEDDGKGYLSCGLTDKVDALGYPNGVVYIDLGSVSAECEIEKMADYVLETVKYQRLENADRNSEDDTGNGDEPEG